MEDSLEPGSYVIAVSGGVDSVVLLDMLHRQPGLHLTVAHFDHGMRPDSAEDANFVRTIAANYKLPFITKRVELGAGTNEATARNARYAFLRQVQQQAGALAIVTAHHQDDVLETAILNLRRGTGRRGLTSLQSTPEIMRPLLGLSKPELISYAVQHSLSWREDSTNHDTHYTRNYIRHRLLAHSTTDARQQLLDIISRLRTLNHELDDCLQAELTKHTSVEGIDKTWFASLPPIVATEVMATWLRQNELADFDRPTIMRLTAAAKTKSPGKQLDVRRGRSLLVKRHHLALLGAER